MSTFNPLDSETTSATFAGQGTLSVWTGVAVALLALAAALAPVSPVVVERFYSQSAYLVLQPYVTAVSNSVPFALLDVLVIVAAGCWIAAVVRDLPARKREGWLRFVTRLFLRTVAIASALYLVFLVTWGLNYRRLPLIEKLQFDAGAVSEAALRRLAQTATDRLNALYDRSRTSLDAPLDPSASPLAAGFARAQRELGAGRTAVPGRPKRTAFDFYLRRAAVDGMTDPFFLETLVASSLLPVERPFVVAHEWGHLAGYADEGEANFIGWLACLRGSDADQYSGWLFLYSELERAVAPAERTELARTLGPGPAADRRAIAERFRREVDPRIFSAGWLVYDSYLRANRVDAGTASYAQVVRLVLGARFDEEWKPLLR